MLLWKIYGPNRNITVDDKSPMNFRRENRWPELIQKTLFTWSWWQPSWLKYVPWQIDMKVLCDSIAIRTMQPEPGLSHQKQKFFSNIKFIYRERKKANNRRNEYLIPLCRSDIFIHQTFSHYYMCDSNRIWLPPHVPFRRRINWTK